MTRVIVAGNYAYAIGGRLWPIDLTDPARPVFYFITLSDTYPGIKHAAAAWDSLYLAAGEAGLRVMDASDPAIPVEVKTLFAPVP
ncbi:MAG: hypothetical protein L6R45_00905 [Anaerolineae bacterium]|nr:hypothetical protein [Anaerolineae bacterium]